MSDFFEQSINNYSGLSTETKPAIAAGNKVPNGSRWREVDTGAEFFFNQSNDAWYLFKDNGKIYDEASGLYKGLLFNAEAPQICSQDYLLALAEGDIPGHSAFSKFGRVAGVGNTVVDMWNGTGIYVWPVAAQRMNVVSTSSSDDLGSTGVEKVMIVGLDGSYTEISEEVTLDGVVDVLTTASFLRVNSCYVTQVGTAEAAVGAITVKNVGNTITYSGISVGNTTCRQMIYTVPIGKSLYVTSINVASGAGGNAVKLNAVIMTPKVRVFGSTVFIPLGELMTINSGFIRTLEMPAKIPAKADLKLSVVGDYSLGAALCTAAVRGWLE